MSEENQTEETKQEATAEAAPQATGVTLEGRGGFLGVKAGMTQVFDGAGNAIAVTVIDLQPNTVTQVKTKDQNGYNGVQVGFLPKRERKRATTKAEQGHVKKLGVPGYYHYQEFRLSDDSKLEGLTVGANLNLDFIKEGDLVDLMAVSKGKGFQGVMKRYHFRGASRTHGVSIVHRMPGSIGQRTDPGKVVKGKKMAGHMGHKRVTQQNLKVVRVDKENNLLLVGGSVPGPKSGIVTIQKAVKA